MDIVNTFHIETGLHAVRHKLSVRNQALLFVIWLRTYPRFHMLSCIFNISVSSVKNEIKGMFGPFEQKVSCFLKWPTVQQWRSKRGYWGKIPCVVAVIDGTSHEINVPGTELQEVYYSGHRNYHAIHSQVLIDNTGVIGI